MKKLISGSMAVCMLAMNAVPALAVSISDVNKDYWAAKEITSVVNDNIMTLSGSRFNPEDSMTRVEFVNSLLKVLSNCCIME